MALQAFLRLISGCVVASVAAASAAWAEQSVMDRGRVVYHAAKVDVMEVGDAPGHVLAIVDQRGLQTNQAGEVGQWSTKVFLDLTNGTGPHLSYTTVTFEDKSTMVTKANGVTTARADGTSTFEGTFDYIGGSGRFSGIKGGGKYAGKRLAPLTPGVPADIYQEYTAAYTLPSR